MKFQVMRQHFGDRMYEPGDTRDADEGDVLHLIINGVLAKAEPTTANKAEPKTANKAAK